MRLSAISRTPLDPTRSSLKRDRLRAHRPYRSTSRDYWGFTYWSLKVTVLERRENRLMASLIARLAGH